MDFKQYLLTHIPHSKVASGGKEVVVICPDCDDKSGHLYISVDDNKPYLRYCVKCSSSGIVNSRFLSMFNIYDPEMTNFLRSRNRDFTKNVPKYHISVLTNEFVKNDTISLNKLSYINNRLDTNLVYSDLKGLKIVLNIDDLLSSNNIRYYTRHRDIMSVLQQDFLGFISADNSYLIMRNLNQYKNYIDTKYVVYNIFNKTDDVNKYYIIPTTIDLNSTNRIRINITEGIFDILSIYLNGLSTIDHTIFCAINGKSYFNTIKYFLRVHGLLNIDIHLYIDNDISDYSLYRLREFSIFNIPIYIHRNIYGNEKDFGVPRSRIIDSIYQLI